MAKRKSTDTTSNEETEKMAEADQTNDASDTSEDVSKDLETAAEAIEAVEVYAPVDETPADSEAPSTDDRTETGDSPADEVIEQAEPTQEDRVQPDEGAVSADESSDIESDQDQEAEDSVVADDHLTEEEAEKLIEEAETVEGHAADYQAVTEPDQMPVAPQVVKETTIERKGGFVPMLLGGAAAAVLGYGVAAYSSQAVWPFEASSDTGFEDEVRDALATQDGSLSDLGARIAELEGVEAPTVDLGPIEEQVVSVQAVTSDLATRLDELAARIDTLERQPMEQAVSEEAIAAYERALADLQAEVEAQRAEVAQMAQEAIQAEGNAEEQAQLAASRAALAEITTALETGAGFTNAVSVLSNNGVTVPEALSAHAESGIPTLSGLIEGFPDAARAALREARSVETDSAEGTNRIATFFANQLGARSVAPRDGDDPDAVLSRVEAAVKSGDLGTALSELSALPDVAQSAIAAWQMQAQTRLEAKTAADGLVQQLLQE